MIPRGEIAPSLLSSDFARLAEQVELVMDAGAKVMVLGPGVLSSAMIASRREIVPSGPGLAMSAGMLE